MSQSCPTNFAEFPSAPAISDTWFRSGFGPLYPIVYAHRSVDAAAPEAKFAIEQLGIVSNSRVLDLCCGSGRHMLHLGRTTASIAGLDYSTDLLHIARNCLPHGTALVRADMRRIPFGQSFDAVVSFFTSFGYFFVWEENLGAVQEVARVLRPGGRFFIDHLNAAHVERNLVPESVRSVAVTERSHLGEQGEFTIRERRWIDPQLGGCNGAKPPRNRRVNKTTTVFRAEDAVGEWAESVALFTEEEFRNLLILGGLRVDRVFGDYSGAPMDCARPRMIAVGHKE